MKRALYSVLQLWKDEQRDRPLVVKGVRGVGKTYLLNKFGRQNYKNIADNLSQIIANLGIIYGSSISPSGTLIILDEIQYCQSAVNSLYLFAQSKEYDVIATTSIAGSDVYEQLEQYESRNIISITTLYPMNFYEYIIASEDELTLEYLLQYPIERPVPPAFAGKLESYLKSYFITGGFPVVVSDWIKNKDISSVDLLLGDIKSRIQLDFIKSFSITDAARMNAVFENIPFQLAQLNNKFMYSKVKKGLRAKELVNPIRNLVNCGIIYKVDRMISHIETDDTSFSLYLIDTGLLRSIFQINPSIILSGYPVHNRILDSIVNSFVVSELKTITNSSPMYWSSGNKAKIDTVFKYKNQIIPIKSSYYPIHHCRSLIEYENTYNPNISIKSTLSNDSIGSESTLSLPLYTLWRINQII